MTRIECRIIRYFATVSDFDVDYLLDKVSVPSLVMHRAAIA
jgi:hypothetical protein